MKKETETEEKVKKTSKKKTPVIKAVAKPKDYSKIYDKNQAYTIVEALEIVKKLNKTKFDASVEVHFRLGINTKKCDQQVRGAISLPHGTGKTDFEFAIAEPAMMKNLAVIAKILGTRGLMPSPKNDTVTMNPVKTVEELKKGKISFKNDDTGNLHAVIGKISFESSKLADNYQTLIETVIKVKPSSAKGTFLKNISIAASMSPGVK